MEIVMVKITMTLFVMIHLLPTPSKRKKMCFNEYLYITIHSGGSDSRGGGNFTTKIDINEQKRSLTEQNP